MKFTLLLCVFIVASVATNQAQEIGTKYSGRAEIPGLGTIEFPTGEWFLEFRRPPPIPNPARRPDYFGFRKVSDTPERLGFRRYDPATAPEQLVHCIDGIAEDLEYVPEVLILVITNVLLARDWGEAWDGKFDRAHWLYDRYERLGMEHRRGAARRPVQAGATPAL